MTQHATREGRAGLGEGLRREEKGRSGLSREGGCAGRETSDRLVLVASKAVSLLRLARQLLSNLLRWSAHCLLSRIPGKGAIYLSRVYGSAHHAPTLNSQSSRSLLRRLVLDGASSGRTSVVRSRAKARTAAV